MSFLVQAPFLSKTLGWYSSYDFFFQRVPAGNSAFTNILSVEF